MKVILAGLPKTGTKTLNAALTELGYVVYDYSEHFWHHSEDWRKIFEENGSVEDFKRMYKDVDAVVDIPACMFWEEISWAFPGAKIILTIRDEASWYKSLCEQANPKGSPEIFRKLLVRCIPTGRRLMRHVNSSLSICLGFTFTTFLKSVPISEMFVKQAYRQHNAYVMQNTPKEKLLVFSVQDGWEPLCKFLGKDVPDKPFPHKNKGGGDILPKLKQHALGKRLEIEIVLFILVALLVFLLACFVSYRYDQWDKLFTVLCMTVSLLLYKEFL